MEDFNVSSWRTNCLLVEESLSLHGELTISSWRAKCILLFSRMTCCDVFVVFWIAPLEPISLGSADIKVGSFCWRYDRTFLIHRNLLWRFIFFVLVIYLVTTLIGQLIYYRCLCFRSYSHNSIVYYFIMTYVCRRYDRTSLLIIFLEDSFDQSCYSTDLPAAATSPCVVTVHFRAIVTGIKLNNFESTL